jgi:tRNA modification GTPase
MLDEQGQVLDEGLLLWMEGPNSYTGEDVVELHCHGNPWILERLVNVALVAGARAAEPGEFTKRAFLNGKMDLIQADAVIQLINASSERALRAARRLLSGQLSMQIEAVHGALVDVLKWVEMSIDFPEEEIEAATEEELLGSLRSISDELSRLVDSFRRGHRARGGARLVLCGRANVGKSSLFNRLLGYRRSIVADVPGTTRDVVEAWTELQGLALQLQDTAGVRETLDVLEEEGIGMTHEAIGAAELALVVVDGSVEETADDRRVLEAVQRSGVEWLGVANKADLGTLESWCRQPGVWVKVSSRQGRGFEELQSLIVERLVGAEMGEEVLLTSQWQKDILDGARANILRAIEVILSGLSPETTAFELYEALDRLDEVRGGRGREDVMDRVFAEFCLGK